MTGARTFTFLGTGTSVGVPMLGCECSVCTSNDPRNRRFRSSVLIQTPAGNILIDTGPEMRLQLLRESIKAIHAVVYTHFHVDHLFGFDDLRVFPWRLQKPMPVYCNEETELVIRRAFAYAFGPGAEEVPIGSIPRIVFERIETEPFTVLDQRFVPIPLQHSHFNVLGFRIDELAYCTDVSLIPDASKELLRDLDVLIVDCLRYKSHPAHFSVNEALETIEQLKPRQAYLTHMSHDLDYETLRQQLPDHIQPAYDGLKFTF